MASVVRVFGQTIKPMCISILNCFFFSINKQTEFHVQFHIYKLLKQLTRIHQIQLVILSSQYGQYFVHDYCRWVPEMISLTSTLHMLLCSATTENGKTLG